MFYEISFSHWTNSGQFHFGINHKHTSKIREPKVNKQIVSSLLYPYYVCSKPIIAIERGSFFWQILHTIFLLAKGYKRWRREKVITRKRLWPYSSKYLLWLFAKKYAKKYFWEQQIKQHLVHFENYRVPVLFLIKQLKRIKALW